MEDAAKEVAKQLENCIRSGTLSAIKNILDSLSNCTTVERIEQQFCSLDPVVLAVDCQQEAIALYLIEKGFTFENYYTYPGQSCDHWCYKKSRGDRCPLQYNTLALAQERGMSRVAALITDIERGVRKPGDGLSSHGWEDMAKVQAGRGKTGSVRMTQSLLNGDTYLTEVDKAKLRLVELGPKYITKDGDTLIHLCAELGPSMVYVCANSGVPVNTQNFVSGGIPAGDTALHIALRKEQRDVVIALLVCGADLSLRNKVGLTPMDQSPSHLKPLLERFRPGLAQAVSRSEHSAMQRLARLWCHPHSIIKDGMSAVQLLQAKAHCDRNAQRCLQLLKHNLKTLELVHAVMCEDLDEVCHITRCLKGWNVNARFGDRRGKTPLSCAVEQKNLTLLGLLVGTGKCDFNLRVSELDLCKTTVPLCFKALHKDCPVEIWKCVCKYSDTHQMREKSCNGNTSVLQALENGKPAKFIDLMIKESGGSCLTHRNQDGEVLREVAGRLQRHDVVAVVDRNLCELVGHGFLIHLPVNFYGVNNMNVRDQSGRSLQDLAAGSGKADDIQATKNYLSAEKLGMELFEASSNGDLKTVARLNTANYQDQNGYTALIRAIVFTQLPAAKVLITGRPALKVIGDNSNRRPLHYAYALPENQGQAFVRLLLERNPEDIESRVDKDGRQAAEYKELRDTPEIQQMLHNARMLDAYGQMCQKMGSIPGDAGGMANRQNELQDI